MGGSKALAKLGERGGETGNRTISKDSTTVKLWQVGEEVEVAGLGAGGWGEGRWTSGAGV